MLDLSLGGGCFAFCVAPVAQEEAFPAPVPPAHPERECACPPLLSDRVLAPAFSSPLAQPATEGATHVSCGVPVGGCDLGCEGFLWGWHSLWVAALLEGCIGAV